MACAQPATMPRRDRVFSRRSPAGNFAANSLRPDTPASVTISRVVSKVHSSTITLASSSWKSAKAVAAMPALARPPIIATVFG
jgi:hypothetical protein